MLKFVLSFALMGFVFSSSRAFAQQPPNQRSQLKKSRLPSQAKPTQSDPSQAQVLSQVSTQVEKPKERLRNTSLSQNVFVPAPGQAGLSLRFTSMSRDLNYKIKNGKTAEKSYETQRGLLAQTRFDRGTESGWGISGEVGTPIGQINETHQGMKDGESKGLTDIIFTAQKAVPQEDRQLFYGGQLKFSPGERVWANDKQSGTLYSGGHTLSAFVGTQKDFVSFVMGGQVRHDIHLDRSESFKSDANLTTNITRSGGNVFSFGGFLEKPFQDKVVGASATWGFVDPSDATVSSKLQKQNFSSDRYNTMNLSFYARLPLKELASVEILPYVNYTKVMNSSGGSLSVEDSTETSNVSLAARWTL